MNCIFRVVILVVFFIRATYCVPAARNFDIWDDVSYADDRKNVTTLNHYASKQRKARQMGSIGVLNFFPVPVDDECVSNDGRRVGVCLNAYECRIQSGDSRGSCAFGLGVCCVFVAHCDMEVSNNLTYIVSPGFPELSRGLVTCTHQIKKIDPEISQFRFDFIHFNVGQPNRITGVCENEILSISGGVNKMLQMCGVNSGQHVYFDVENLNETVTLTMNFTKKNLDRLWEIKVTQIPFSERAPSGCLQYHRGRSGIIQTFNFGDNGRHLANQEYTICTRQEAGMCSIVYEPCDENSFRIGANEPAPNEEDEGSGMGAVTSADEARSCSDRVFLPCDSEEFLVPGMMGPSTCDIARCGTSLCSQTNNPCRIESSTIPFNIGVQFGATARMESPDDNLGMCLQYEQQPCAV